MLPLEEPTAPVMPLIPQAWPEIIVGAVFFLIMWWIVAKKIVPTFEKTYEQRTAEITGGIEKAEKAQAEAAAALAAYQQQLASAREEAGKIREEARAEAASIAAEIRQKASDDADRLIASAKAQIEAERSGVVRALRGEIGGLALGLAGKIVGESLEDDARAMRSIDRFLDELEQQTVEA